MCWSMTYYEVAIRPNGVPEPQACYSRVNVLEPVRWFHLQPFLLRGETVYDITSGQCACDFLNTRKGRHGEKGRLLRERLREFILERMELPCLEPCLILTWRDGKDGKDDTARPPATESVSFTEFDAIFHRPDPAGAYRFQR